ASDPSRTTWPSYVVDELRSFVKCGLPEFGFAMFVCGSCHGEHIVGLSCKGRGFCPSCTGRRMAETAAHLSDHVFPNVSLRQWVISVPQALRYWLNRNPALLTAVHRIIIRTIAQYYQAGVAAKAFPQHGAVTSIQRFGGHLNLNL